MLVVLCADRRKEKCSVVLNVMHYVSEERRGRGLYCLSQIIFVSVVDTQKKQLVELRVERGRDGCVRDVLRVHYVVSDEKRRERERNEILQMSISVIHLMSNVLFVP